MAWVAVAGSVVGGLLASRSAKKQRNASEQSQLEELYAQRPNQTSPWGSVNWTKDGDTWNQTSTLDPQDAARLQQFRDVAGSRMEKAKSFRHDPSEYKIDYGWAANQPKPSLGGMLQPFLGAPDNRPRTEAPTYSNPMSHFYQGLAIPPTTPQDIDPLTGLPRKKDTSLSPGLIHSPLGE